jgi:RND family efflux transporter MFP subunit
MQRLIRFIIPALLLFGGWIGLNQLAFQKEKEKRPDPVGRVIKTQVLELSIEDFRTKVITQGVVRAHNEGALTATVAGKVLSISPGLEDGAFFNTGEILITLEDEDFAGAVVSAEAQLARAQALYSQEEAKAKQARLNWEDLGYQEEPNELVLRLPQLREAEANVKAANASLEKAQRDLGHTKIRAPYNGRVLTRAVAIGQSVSPGTSLAQIFSTEFVEVRLPIAATELAFLTIPESRDQPPVDVELTDSLTSESNAHWTGKIVGTEGSLDVESRELFAIARIHDPFSLKLPPNERKAPLRIGQPVQATIEGNVLEKVIAIPRAYVRQLNRMYLVDKETMMLIRHEISPIWSDKEYHVIRDPEIEDGALLATTRLVYAPNVSKVEILPPTVEEEEIPETVKSTSDS